MRCKSVLEESSLAFEILFSFFRLRSSHFVRIAARQPSSTVKRKNCLQAVSKMDMVIGKGRTEGKCGEIV